MRYLLTTIATLGLLLLSFQSNAQVEARLHQVFDASKAKKVAIKIDETKHEVNLKETYSTAIIVEIIVTLNHASPEVMQDLVTQGRYELEANLKDGVLTFSRVNGDAPDVIIGGVPAEEYIIYNIAIPEYLEF